MPRRAFTLVELLVVIAVIGLLSTIAVVSLNASRIKARDTKRLVDLRQISQAIELYSYDYSHLPRDSQGWCTYISDPVSGYGAAFQNDLSAYLPKVPLDPILHGEAGDYVYINVDNKTKYTLCARMEQPTGNNYSLCYQPVSMNYCFSPNGT
jgi:type II secretion system protein G